MPTRPNRAYCVIKETIINRDIREEMEPSELNRADRRHLAKLSRKKKNKVIH